MEVDHVEAMKRAKEQAEREADKMFKPGTRLLDREAAVTRLTNQYFQQYVKSQMSTGGRMETPLTIEKLIEILNRSGVMTVAGFNGSCERVISHSGLVRELEKELSPKH